MVLPFIAQVQNNSCIRRIAEGKMKSRERLENTETKDLEAVPSEDVERARSQGGVYQQLFLI